MKNAFLLFFSTIAASSVCFASNEGVPSYYSGSNKAMTANRAAYGKYQNYGYTKYVGNSGQKQLIGSENYSYQIPRPQMPVYNGTTTTNGIAQPTDVHNTTIFADYSRRFADFEFKTGVNSVLEWDDMIFNELNVGASHVFNIHGFDLGVYGSYTYGKLSSGGMSMDYDLEPYDYAYPNEGIFTISMGDQSGETSKLKIGVTAHHVWDIGGWKISPHIGYEIFKHDLKMSNHIYPNPGVYLPLMTADGRYVFGDTQDNYFAVPQDVTLINNDDLYQVCMGPEDILVVQNPTGVDLGGGIQQILSLNTIPYDENTMGLDPWGVPKGDCVVIGGDGVISVDGTTHIYNTTWTGFYLGLEIEKQMTLSDKLRFYAQVSTPKYSSEGTWPNRDDWQQNPSFLDEGDNDAFAYEAEMEYVYSLSDRLQLSLKADTNYFHIGKIPGELYVAESYIFVEDSANPGSYYIEKLAPYTEYVSESLKEATWQSFGLHIGLKYSF